MYIHLIVILMGSMLFIFLVFCVCVFFCFVFVFMYVMCLCPFSCIQCCLFLLIVLFGWFQRVFFLHILFNLCGVILCFLYTLINSHWWPSWSWSYDSLIYNYLCNQCLSPLTLWVRIPLRRGVLDTALIDKVFQWLASGRWFSLDTLVSSTNKIAKK